MQTTGVSGKPDVPSKGPGRRPESGLRTFESLGVVNYRYYVGASMAQMACMNMQMVASGWFVYNLTGSSALLGVTALASAIPQLTVSFVGGTVADRLPKKLVILLGLIASSLVVLWIAVSTTLGIITWQYLVVSSFLQGTIMSLMMPSRQAIISELVGRDKLMNAVALNAAVMNINQIGGPAIAGFIIAGMGISGVYYLMTFIYVAGMLVLLPMRYSWTRAAKSAPRQNMFVDIRDGLYYVRQNKILLTLLILTLLTVFLSMPFRQLLPVFTESILKVGPEEYGILVSVSGVGALMGSLFIATMGSKNRGILFLHTGVITGVSIIAFAISTNYWVSLGIMFISGVGQSGRMALSNTLLQSYTEDAFLGRVMSLSMMQMGITSFGVFGVSVAAEFIGVQWAVAITAGLLLLITAYYYVFSSRIRNLQ